MPSHLTNYQIAFISEFVEGTEKVSFLSAVAEWSDGDSVALHIAYKLDYFCANDRGIAAGTRSVFNDSIYRKIHDKFGFHKLSPIELANQIMQ